MAVLMHAVNYLKVNNAEFLRVKIGSVWKFFIILMKNLPGHCTEQRYHLLIAFFNLFNSLFK